MNKLLRITGCWNYLHCFYVSDHFELQCLVVVGTSTSINLFIYQTRNIISK